MGRYIYSSLLAPTNGPTLTWIAKVIPLQYTYSYTKSWENQQFYPPPKKQNFSLRSLSSTRPGVEKSQRCPLWRPWARPAVDASTRNPRMFERASFLVFFGRWTNENSTNQPNIPGFVEQHHAKRWVYGTTLRALANINGLSNTCHTKMAAGRPGKIGAFWPPRTKDVHQCYCGWDDHWGKLLGRWGTYRALSENLV